MDIILKTDIAGLGYKDEVISVKPGYGRNYLIPNGFAVLATTSNKKVMAENLKQAEHKAEKIKTAAQDLANAIGDQVIIINMKAGESGKIFGRVTTTQIADFLKEKGFEIDKKKITLGDIKYLGDYDATLDLHKEVKHDVKISVVSDEVVVE